MSKELIEKLRAFAPYASPNAADMMHEAADALEAKAAPVGEREAFEAWLPLAYRDGDKGESPKFTKYNMEAAFAAGAAYQRQVHAEHEGPDYGDGPEFEGWAERSAQQPQSAEACPHGCDSACPQCYLDKISTPQPSAGVVMPERKDESKYRGTGLIAARQWNACLDEFARLNGKEVV